MIGINNQYLIKFTLGDIDDFIAEEDLIEFLLVEQAGNILPTFEMMFILKDSLPLSYLNEGNTLNMAIGRSFLELVNIPLVISRLNFIKQGSNQYQVYINGTFNASDYIIGDGVKCTGIQSGIETVLNEASDYFRVKSNITKSYDSQNWIQYGTSTKRFIDETWLHSYIPNSFIGIGITIEEFILKDMKKAIKNDPAWYFSTVGATDVNEQIIPVSFTQTSNQSGFHNYLAGYDRELQLLDMVSGSNEKVKTEISPLLAIGVSSMNRNSKINKPMKHKNMWTDNMHANYWKARSQNLLNLTSFGTVSTKIAFSGIFRQVKLLDYVLLGEPDINGTHLNAHKSGMYFVSKVVRHIANRKFTTNIELVRESLNEIRGDFM